MSFNYLVQMVNLEMANKVGYANAASAAVALANSRFAGGGAAVAAVGAGRTSLAAALEGNGRCSGKGKLMMVQPKGPPATVKCRDGGAYKTSTIFCDAPGLGGAPVVTASAAGATAAAAGPAVGGGWGYIGRGGSKSRGGMRVKAIGFAYMVMPAVQNALWYHLR